MSDLKEPIIAYLDLCNEGSTVLGLTFGEKKITPGQHIPKEEARSEPKLSFSRSNDTYIVLAFDLDAPMFLGFMTPILHWGLTGLRSLDGTSNLESGNSPFIADYAAPAPPPGSRAHRYVFLLYKQPDDLDLSKWTSLDGKKVGVMPRARYDLKAFETAANLETAVACNYFLSK